MLWDKMATAYENVRRLLSEEDPVVSIQTFSKSLTAQELQYIVRRIIADEKCAEIVEEPGPAQEDGVL